MYQSTGKIKLINDLQTFPSGFTKREFVITTNEGSYPQDLKFETVKDKTAMLDQFSEGQEVTVSFDIRGNEYNGKYYVNLSCWRLEAGAGSSGSAAPAKNGGQNRAKTQSGNDSGSDGDFEPSPSDFRKSDDDADDDIPF